MPVKLFWGAEVFVHPEMIQNIKKHKLTLNQMQLLAYAIYSTQKDGKTEFIKANFEKIG